MSKLDKWDLLWLVVSVAICLFFFVVVCGLLSDPPPKAYHRWFYAQHASTWKTNTWLGIEIEKNPMDMQIYQEIIYETKPDMLIEAGTYKGGSAYFFASLFDEMGHGRVLTIDIEEFPGLPAHPRITYLLGSSTSPEIVSKIKSLIQPGEKVMVVLDSDHHAAHVRKELEIYNPLVTAGNYLVVEDTNINGHPVLSNFGPGPGEAAAQFLLNNHEFLPDNKRERYGFTFNPGGWLRKTRQKR